MKFWGAWLSSLIFMLWPQVDLFFDSTMSRHMVLQPIIFTFLGLLIGKKIRFDFGVFNVFGISGLIFFISNYLFWMLPRSLDLTLINEVVDKSCHICLVLGGFILAKSVARMAFFVRAAFGINFLAMFSALGLFYSVYEEQACASYSLIQQKEAGIDFLAVTFPLWLAHLIWIFTKNYDVQNAKLSKVF